MREEKGKINKGFIQRKDMETGSKETWDEDRMQTTFKRPRQTLHEADKEKETHETHGKSNNYCLC